jgi:hypothetical protein
MEASEDTYAATSGGAATIMGGGEMVMQSSLENTQRQLQHMQMSTQETIVAVARR